MKKKLTNAIMWAVCGYINWGLTLGAFDHQYPWEDCTSPAAITALAGPFGTPAVLLLGHPFHWRVKPPTADERFKAYQAQYGEKWATRERFEQRYN